MPYIARGQSVRMATTEITFDKLVYIDRLKSVGIDDAHARAHAEALDLAFRDTVATKGDVRDEISRLEQKIEILGRDLTIRMGGIAILLFGALASMKFFGVAISSGTDPDKPACHVHVEPR